MLDSIAVHLFTICIYRYSVLVLETRTPWAKDPEELVRRNTHGVGREVIAKKVKQWQQLSPW